MGVLLMRDPFHGLKLVLNVMAILILIIIILLIPSRVSQGENIYIQTINEG